MPRTINSFYFHATEVLDKAIPTADVRNRDLTNTFFAELDNYIKLGYTISININGMTRGGKTSAGWVISNYIHHCMIKHKRIPKHIPFTLYNIRRDQEDFAYVVKDPLLKECVFLIDEWSSLEEAGENATAQSAWIKEFTNIHAGRHIHRVSCSPDALCDPTADIILELVPGGQDRETQTTQFLLYYRYIKGGGFETTLIGHVIIDVSRLIRNWVPLENIYYKKEQNPAEKQSIKSAAAHDLYVQYIIRKHERMALLTEHHIQRPRELHYAAPILKTFLKLRSINTIMKVTEDMVLMQLEAVVHDLGKVDLSILGRGFMTRRICALLGFDKSLWIMHKKIEAYNQETEKLLTARKPLPTREHQRTTLIEGYENLSSIIREQHKKLETYIQLNETYHNDKPITEVKK